jgi:hypothetical protein
MALEGKIKDFGITDILQLIGMQKKTGLLTLNSELDTVTVTFDNGMVVAAESFKKWKMQVLGQTLIQAGCLTEGDLEQALAVQKETGQKLGRILIRQEMIRPKDLSAMIQLQVRETIYRIFEWKEGDYRFEQIPVTYDTENMIPISCENVLMEAMRIMDEWPMIREVVSTPSLVFRKTDERRNVQTSGESLDKDVDEMFEGTFKEKDPEHDDKALQKDFPLSLAEEKIYRLVDGEKSVQKLIHLCRVGEFETCKALYSLVSAGLIQPIDEKFTAPSEEDIHEKRQWIKKVLRNVAAYAIMLLFILSLIASSRRPGGGILFNLAGSMAGRFDQIRDVHVVKEMNQILFASHVYFLEIESLPETLEDLVQKGLLEKRAVLDPWGNPYSFEVQKKKIVLLSSGKDRQGATADDLVKETYF